MSDIKDFLLRVQREQSATEQAPKVDGMPWWQTKVKRFVREYKSLDDLQCELEIVTSRGWYIESMNTTEGHINLGRTVTGTLLTGGIYALLGGSRTKGKNVVVWTRA